MASLCLPNAELFVGVRWDKSAALERALSDPSRPAVLLYPGAGAIDVAEHPPHGPVTLVVVDGTWWQAKKLLRENPALAKLPRYSFTPPRPSEYRIRKEPNEAYVSTIEALVHVLGVLEGDPQRFLALLAPFRAMVDAQIDCERRMQGTGIRHKKKPRRLPGTRLPPLVRERGGDVVCVVGEANAWPYRSRERGAVYEDELVHWVARRLGTGETFEYVVAPGNALAPRTASYVGLTEAALLAGGTTDDLCEQWRGFVRASDVLCSWGRYATSLFAARGGLLPHARLDFREVARVLTRGKVGTLDDFLARIHASPQAPLAGGRAGVRLGQVARVAAHFAELAAQAAAS